MRLHNVVWLFAGLVCATSVFASPDPPLDAGEQLKYRVSWAIVPGAGEINVTAARDANDPSRLLITSTTETRGLAHLLLPFNAADDSLYDIKSGRLISLHERSNTRGKHAEHMVTFDYAQRQAIYADMGATVPRYLPMPAGGPSDLITALLETRTWNLKPGEARDALVLFNDDFYLLTIHALRYENISGELGDFRTLVLEPRMEKTEPKGMFRKGSTVRVWISQDERRLPVMFEVEFKIGTGTAELVSYTPPTATAAPTAPVSAAPASDAKDSRP